MKKSKSARVSGIVLVICFSAWMLFAALWIILTPDRKYSQNEKRYLSTRPHLSWDTLLSGRYGEQIEDWLNDQFPAREEWAGANAAFELVTGLNGNSGVYLMSDGSLVRTPVADDQRVTSLAASRITSFAVETDLPCRFMLVPSAGYVREEEMPSLHFEYHDGDIMDRVRAQLGECVEWIEIRSALASHKSEKIFFATDHHWTSLGAYYGYLAYCEAADLHPVSRERFEVESVPGFKGTNWSTACLWNLPGEDLEIWTDPALKVTVSIPESGAEQESMLFRGRLEEMDKYTVFLDGNHSLVTIDNPDSDGGVLLLVKDSYGHILVPFLAAHYSRIIMVDMRYYKSPLSELCQNEGVTDVLFLYSVGTFTEASDLAFLR